MLAPERIWWKPLHRMEKSWVIVALVWCFLLTAMMPLWFIYGRQNVPVETLRTTPAEYQEQVTAFVEANTVDTLNGLPVVAPAPGADVYLIARQWQWYPVLQLKKGETYRLHLSSLDVQHGFSLQPVNLNLQVLPKYDYIVTLSPTQSGEFSIVCNEFCAIGHHLMVGKIIVTD
jgi:cytochrome c oxidase subunit II